MYAWLYDLESTRTPYTVLILAEAFTQPQLDMFETHWIALGERFGWPLANKQRPKDKMPEPEEPLVGRWDIKKWRRDPEVKQKLAEAKKTR